MQLVILPPFHEGGDVLVFLGLDFLVYLGLFQSKGGLSETPLLILLVCRRKSLLLQFREGPWASKVPPVMSLQFNSFTTIRVARDRNEGLTQSMDHTPRLAR